MVNVGVSRVEKTSTVMKWTPLSTSMFYTRAETCTVELWETQTIVAELLMRSVSSSLFV